MTEKPAVFTQASAIKIADTVHRVMGAGRGEAPIAKRPRHIAPPGSGKAAVVAGSVAVASDSIGGPTETTWEDVPESVKSAVPNGDSIPDGTKCWKLGQGDGLVYQLVASLGEDDSVEDVYMVPVAGEDGLETLTLYNSAGDVDADVPLQTKQFTMRVGGSTKKISIIDVEKCG